MERVLRAETAVSAAGLFVFLLAFGLLGGPPEARWPGAALVLAPAVMVWVHRRAAAATALLAALVWSFGGAAGFAVLFVYAYLAIALVIAKGDRRGMPDLVPHRVPPEVSIPPEVSGLPKVSGLPRVAGHAETAAWVLLVVAALNLAAAYAAAPPWSTPALVVGGLSVALFARARDARRGLHRLFTRPQPLYDVRVIEEPGSVTVLLPDENGETAREFTFPAATEQPVTEQPATEQPVTKQPATEQPITEQHASEQPANERPVPAGLELPGDQDVSYTRPGMLYGSPRTGSWCTVEVSGRLLIPAAPVGEVLVVPYDPEENRAWGLDDPAPVPALLPFDHAGAPAELREHRLSPVRAWTATVALGIGAGLVAGLLARAGGTGRPGIALLVALAVAGGYEYGWRTQLRPRLRWHAGGVVNLGFRGFDRRAWAGGAEILRLGDAEVMLVIGKATLTVAAPPPWPSPASQRTADELVAALREARDHDPGGLDPPAAIDEPVRPPLIYPLGLFSALLAVLIVG